MTRRSRGGWPWFFAWAIPGVALGLQVSAIGVLVLPLGALIALLLGHLGRRWPESLGLLEGMAAVAFVVAYGNRDYQPCPKGGAVGRLSLGPGEQSPEAFSCGGVDPVLALTVGLALGLIGLLAYALTRRSRKVAAGSSDPTDVRGSRPGYGR